MIVWLPIVHTHTHTHSRVYGMCTLQWLKLHRGDVTQSTCLKRTLYSIAQVSMPNKLDGPLCDMAASDIPIAHHQQQQQSAIAMMR